MTDEERAGYNNLILLCQNHHTLTNDSEKYTVEILSKMKLEHEMQFTSSKLHSNPSMLFNTINAIAGLNFPKDRETENLTVIDIDEKIKFNNLKINISIIEEYKIYYRKINSLYTELECQ
jgi:hypothetical protein